MTDTNCPPSHTRAAIAAIRQYHQISGDPGTPEVNRVFCIAGMTYETGDGLIVFFSDEASARRELAEGLLDGRPVTSTTKDALLSMLDIKPEGRLRVMVVAPDGISTHLTHIGLAKSGGFLS